MGCDDYKVIEEYKDMLVQVNRFYIKVSKESIGSLKV